MPAIIGKKFSVSRVFKAIRSQQELTYNRKYDQWCFKWPKKLKIGKNTHPMSKTLQVLYRLGTKCRFCGLEAQYFQQERFSLQKPWHLVPYGIDYEGNPIRITKDHIVPKTRGGYKTNLLNLQILCQDCNEYKGNLVPASLPPLLQECVDNPSEEDNFLLLQEWVAKLESNK